MPSMIFAYAFLKASYSQGIRNPVDAVVPLVKRALIRFGSHDIDQVRVQRRITDSIGLVIPLNVIRYTFPKLSAEGIVHLENRIYKLKDKQYVDPTIDDLVRVAREQYERIKSTVNRHLMVNETSYASPDEFIEDWLDNSCLAFLGGNNPAFGAGRDDREINRQMYLIIQENASGQFLDDLTGVALGDSLFRAIKAITEYDIPEEFAANYSEKMSAVEVYFDTRWVMRALGFGDQQMTSAARELLALCKSSGCKTSIFYHNLEEMQRVIRTVADNMVAGAAIEGDVASFAIENGLGSSELIEFSSLLEEKVNQLGLSVREKPLLTVELSISERELDRQLEVDLQQSNELARITDISSLTSIYRLRSGAAKTFLEKCDAIFITTNKGLADSAVRFFRAMFKERNEVNRVQLCMTDVVFSTRLWTKLPTSLERLPRDQIVSHIMGYLNPSPQLREEFRRHLRDLVQQGKISEEAEMRLRLSRFVDQALASEFDSEKITLTSAEFKSVATKVAELQREVQRKFVENVRLEERDRSKRELDLALEEFQAKDRELIDQNDEIATLRREVEEGQNRIRQIEEISGNIGRKISRLATIVSAAAAGLCLIWLFDVLITATGAKDVLTSIFKPSKDYMDLVSRALNLFASFLLTWLTLYGFSLAGARTALERAITKKVMEFLFK